MPFSSSSRDRITDTIWGVGRTVSITTTETIAILNRRTSRFIADEFLSFTSAIFKQQFKKQGYFLKFDWFIPREPGKKKTSWEKNNEKGKEIKAIKTCYFFFTPKYLLNFWHCIQIFSGRICLCLNYRSKKLFVFIMCVLCRFFGWNDTLSVAGFCVCGAVTYQWGKEQRNKGEL